MLSLAQLYTTVTSVATINVHTLNTVVLVTLVLKVQTLNTNVYKSQKGKLKSSKNWGNWVKRNGFSVTVVTRVCGDNPKFLNM